MCVIGTQKLDLQTHSKSTQRVCAIGAQNLDLQTLSSVENEHLQAKVWATKHLCNFKMSLELVLRTQNKLQPNYKDFKA